MIIENPESHQLKFVLMTTIDSTDSTYDQITSGGGNLNFETLGMVQNAPDTDIYEVGNIVKVVTVQGKTIEEEEEKNHTYIVSLVLRTTGLV